MFSRTSDSITGDQILTQAKKLAASQLQPPPPPASIINHGMDYVIVYRYGQKLSTSSLKREKQATEGYYSLTTNLSSAQLYFVIKQGQECGTLLILVGCPRARLYKEYKKERIRDFLIGISMDSTDLTTDGSTIMNNHLESRSPLHDDDFNKISVLSKKWMIDDDDLRNFRNHFGEKITFYFAFLHFYFLWLMIPSGLGVLVYVAPINSLSIGYALFMAAWGIAFTEMWKRKQKELALKWGVLHCSEYEKQRATFKGGDATMAGKVSDGEEMTFVPAWKTFLRRGLTFLGTAFGAVLLTIIVTLVFMLQLFLHEYYIDPFQEILHYVPTIGYVLLIPTMTGLYNKWSLWQIFWLAISLFLIAWLYIPFGDHVLPYLNEFDISHDHQKVDFQRLQDQFVSFVVTGQIVGFLEKMVVPFVMSFYVKPTAKQMDAKVAVTLPRSFGNNATMDASSLSTATHDIKFIKKLNKQVGLEEYNIYTDYVEMVTQFGYVSMFSGLWPLAAICCVANNWIRLRSNAVRLFIYKRRPVPRRAENIGPWLRNMETIVWLSSINMASFGYLFHQTTDLHSQYVPLYTLLAILLSEHLFVGLHLATQFVVSLLPNWPEMMIKKEDYKIKQKWLRRLDDENKANFAPAIFGATLKLDPIAKLWNNKVNMGTRTEAGVQLIRNHFKYGRWYISFGYTLGGLSVCWFFIYE